LPGGLPQPAHAKESGEALENIIRNYTLRINAELLEKFHVVSRANGRSANMQLLIYIQKTVQRYESDNGTIRPQGLKFSSSKNLPEAGQRPKK